MQQSEREGREPYDNWFCCEGGDPYSGKEAPTPHIFEMFEAKGIAKPLFNQYLFIYLFIYLEKSALLPLSFLSTLGFRFYCSACLKFKVEDLF